MKSKKKYLVKRLPIFNIDVIGESAGGIDTLHSALFDLFNENVENGIESKSFITNQEKMRDGSVLIDEGLPYNEQIGFDILHNDISSKLYQNTFFNKLSQDNDSWFVYKNLLLAGMNTTVFNEVGNLANQDDELLKLNRELVKKLKDLDVLPIMEYNIIKDFWQDYRISVLDLIKKANEFDQHLYIINKFHPQGVSGIYLGDGFGIFKDFKFDYVIESSLNSINHPIDFQEYVHIIQLHPELKGNGHILIIRKGNPISEYLVHYNRALKRIDRNTATLKV